MKTTNTFLDKILANKIREVEGLKKLRPLISLENSLSERKTEIRNFPHAINHSGRISLIAEIKKASPSAGLIKRDFNHIKIAKEYQESGLVDAISVLTEKKYFQGDIKFIRDIKKTTSMPILRKDFIFDEYQVYESYLAEADAILLIVAILEPKTLRCLISIVHERGLNCVVETHSAKEIEIAVRAGARIIGVNSRDLKTFKVDNKLFGKLVNYMPADKLKIAESGVANREEVKRAYKAGANAVLIGTSIMRSHDIKKKLKELTSLVRK